MIKLFRKTSWKIKGIAFTFFRNIFLQLPQDYKFLLDGLDKGLYRRFSVNHAMKGHFYSITFDPLQSDKEMRKGKRFRVENIKIIQDGEFSILNMDVYDGLWIGFEIESNILEFDNYKIDTSDISKNERIFATPGTITNLTNGLYSEKLDLNDLSEIQVDGITYYQIKDFDDGNYIAIDSQGKVYGLIHDPYKIEIINDSLSQFVSDVNSGKFNLSKFQSIQNGYA